MYTTIDFQHIKSLDLDALNYPICQLSGFLLPLDCHQVPSFILYPQM